MDGIIELCSISALEKYVMISSRDIDQKLNQNLLAITQVEKDYWSFVGKAHRDHSHGLFQYPAMMVPQLVKEILEQVQRIEPDINEIFDPFSGSGTILTESMLHGLSFSGVDINPLAVLLCKVKSGPFFIKSLASKSTALLKLIDKDGTNEVDINFPNIDKWFRHDVQIGLSKIRRAIKKEPSLWARRFFWVCLAEAVRSNSNSRTSTYKLHIRTKEDIENKNFDPVNSFRTAVKRNFKNLYDQEKFLKQKGYLNRGRYYRNTSIALADVRSYKGKLQSDLIITSPPYGDNVSTVPYGQYSYLPLRWIDLLDIENSKLSIESVNSTYQIDAKSLGGSQKINKEMINILSNISPSFSKCIDKLKGEPPDRVKRVTAFFSDLNDGLRPILNHLRHRGLMVWVLGNRSVGRRKVPMDRILTDLFLSYGVELVCKLNRNISSKRMATKNNISTTMSTEKILVFRKAG